MLLDTLTGFVRRTAAVGESDEALVRRFVEIRSEDAFGELVQPVRVGRTGCVGGYSATTT